MTAFKAHPFTPAFALAMPLLSLLCSPAQAQQASAGVLPIVNVTATRAKPLPTPTPIDASSLRPKLAATSDTASLLADIPGLSLNGAGGVSSLPAINGLADDRLRIKVDGMDLMASCPNHMNPPLSYLDPTHVGTLKVFAGITPVSAGGDSIGGSVIAESRTPQFAARPKPCNKGRSGYVLPQQQRRTRSEPVGQLCF